MKWRMEHTVKAYSRGTKGKKLPQRNFGYFYSMEIPFLALAVLLSALFSGTAVANPVCGSRPNLDLSVTNIYWASYTDYTNGKLSVDYGVINNSESDAAGAAIVDSDATNGVTPSLEPLPLLIGSIPGAGGNASFTMPYNVPAGVPGFSSIVHATAQDSCGNTYCYPGPDCGVVEIAMQYLGVPFVWGGASPSGFDASGLVMYVYAQVGVSLPHSVVAQYDAGTPINYDELVPGDLVFFDGFNHEGIYIGGGNMIHAPFPGEVVQISPLSAYNFSGACRL